MAADGQFDRAAGAAEDDPRAAVAGGELPGQQQRAVDQVDPRLRLRARRPAASAWRKCPSTRQSPTTTGRRRPSSVTCLPSKATRRPVTGWSAQRLHLELRRGRHRQDGQQDGGQRDHRFSLLSLFRGQPAKVLLDNVPVVGGEIAADLLDGLFAFFRGKVAPATLVADTSS